MQDTPIRGHDGRILGYVRDNVFRKDPVRKSAHFYRRYDGWGCDVAALIQAERAGAQWIEIQDLESGATYRAALGTMRTHGIPVDHGHGAQLVLPLRFWDVPELQPTLFGNFPAMAGFATI